MEINSAKKDIRQTDTLLFLLCNVALFFLLIRLA